MKRKPELVWHAWNTDHIKKHGISVTDVEEAYRNEFARSDSYLNRQAIFGKTGKGRLIAIAVSYRDQKNPFVLSARAMSRKERRKYNEEDK